MSARLISGKRLGMARLEWSPLHVKTNAIKEAASQSGMDSSSVEVWADQGVGETLKKSIRGTQQKGGAFLTGTLSNLFIYLCIFKSHG